MRPGINVSVNTTPPTRTFESTTGASFVGGLAAKGPADRAVVVTSLREFEQVFGPRVSYGFGWDAADIFFRGGGSRFCFGRTVGPGAVTDKVTLNDASTPTPAAALRVETKGPEDSNLAAAVAAGSDPGTYVLIITDNGAEVERSYDLLDNDTAVAWGSASRYVNVFKLGANDPAVVGATALAGGTDDRAAIGDTHRAATLARFNRDLGTGQVSYPGATTAAIHTALLQHAAANQRFALCDGSDTAVATALIGQVDAQQIATVQPSHGFLLAPWARVQGVVRNTLRTVPYSIIQAALIAQADGRTGNPNIPAAGVNGESNLVVSLTQTYSDADRELLNNEGIVVARMVNGRCRTYGYRTMAREDSASYDGFVEGSAARVRMAIVAEALAGAEQFVFRQIDGQGHAFDVWESFLSGMLDRYWAMGALFGQVADEAYLVDTGPTVNTPATIADRQLNARLALRTSPFAEMVNVEISRVSVTQSL